MLIESGRLKLSRAHLGRLVKEKDRQSRPLIFILHAGKRSIPLDKPRGGASAGDDCRSAGG